MHGSRASAVAKRKAAASPSQAPPAKRCVNGKLAADDVASDMDIASFDDDDDDDDSVLSDDLHAPLYVGTPGSLGEWQDTIQKVVRNVVAIRFCQTCSFDTDPALTSEATGFVVDSERGYGSPPAGPAAADMAVQVHHDEPPRCRRRALLGSLRL